VFDDWEPEQHPIAGKQKVHCALYTCAAKERLQFEDRDFIKITLRGQSFLLNQIRMMVSCGIVSVLMTQQSVQR
jgi:tRNA U38,U39,U40 pseudouridine synthase TruA